MAGKRPPKGRTFGPGEFYMGDKYLPTADGIRFHRRPETFLGAGGEKGGGKTWACIWEALRWSIEIPGNRWCFFRQKQTTLMDTTMNTFWSICPKELIAGEAKGDRKIILTSGSEILYRGLSGTALQSQSAIKQFLEDLKSMELGGFYVNEGSQTLKEFWDTLKGTLRWIPPGMDRRRMVYRGLVDSNPEPGWFHDTFLRRLPDDHAYIWFHARNNRGLIDGYHDRFADMPESWRRRYVDGAWDFSQEGDDYVYPYALVVAAMLLEIIPPGDAVPVYGLDPAGIGRDEAVLTQYLAGKVRQWAWPVTEGPDLVAKVENVLSVNGRGLIMADGRGLGAPIVDYLRRDGYAVQVVRDAGKPMNGDKFGDVRAEMFWNLRTLLEKKALDIPDDDRLKEQMIALKFGTKDQKIWVEPKEVYKKRVGCSPDRLESLVYATSTPKEMRVRWL